jgi:sigma-B regulation protein RsbU (phosphoserine phosphatase)
MLEARTHDDPPAAADRWSRQEREIESLCREVLERYEEATFVYRLSDCIGSVLGERAIADLVVSHVVAVLGARSGEIWLTHGEGLDLVGTTSSALPGLPESYVTETVATGRAWTDDGARGEAARVSVALPDGEGGRLGAIVLHGRTQGRGYLTGEIKLLTAVAALTSAFVRNDRLAEKARRSDARRREDEIARQVHRGLLPRVDPLFAGLDLSGGFRAADVVGGDYYGYVAMVDGSLGVAIADVSGHGIGAALYMATAKGALQSEAREALSPTSIVSRVNEVLSADFSAADMFATLFLARFRPDGRKITWTNAGHNPPLLLKASGEVVPLSPCGPALGIVAGARWSDADTDFEPGDVLVIYTDGIVEARDRDRRFYGIDRLVEAVRRPARTAREIRENVLRDLAAHAAPGAPHDDMTLVIVRGVSLAEAS